MQTQKLMGLLLSMGRTQGCSQHWQIIPFETCGVLIDSGSYCAQLFDTLVVKLQADKSTPLWCCEL